MLTPGSCDMALKEWAVAIRALAQGKQVMILRKGGIHREDREFRVVHPEFLLFPTYEHQKAELLKEEWHSAVMDTHKDNDVPGLVTLGYWCRVTDKFEVRDESALDGLSPYHIWADEYARKRLHWRPKQPLTVALLRVYELQQHQALPVLDEYIGCKSWVDLGQDMPLGYMNPVISDEAFEEQASLIRRSLSPAPLASG
jgi:hypothetical protein